MATHALGPGTANITLNAPAEWRSALGRAAFQRDQSRNEFVCGLIERALESEYPELAAEIKSVREKHRLAARIVGMKVGSSVGILLVGAALWLSATGQIDDQIRRPAGARVVRSARRMEDA